MIVSRMEVSQSRRTGGCRVVRQAVTAASVAGLVVVAALLGGCATGAGNQAAPVNPADVIGQASEYTTLTAPPADKALVCFARPSGFVGMAVPWFIIESEKILCTLRNGSYYYLPVEPGAHTYSCKPGPGAKPVPMTVELQAGRVYVFLGSLSGRMALQTPEKANALLPKLEFRKQRGD